MDQIKRSSARIRKSRNPGTQYDDLLGNSHSKLLELPAEIRLRILRELLIHDCPIVAVPPSEILHQEDDRLVSQAPEYVVTLEDIPDSDRPGLREEVAQLRYDFPGYSVRECLGALNKSCTYEAAEDEIRQSMKRETPKRYTSRSTPLVKLSRSILLVNRQLYTEGSVVLYEGNHLSLRLRAHGYPCSWHWDFNITYFDHRRENVDHPSIDHLHPTLAKFTNLHFDIRLSWGVVPSCVRSKLRWSVCQLNEKQNLSRPRNISVAYEDSITTTEEFHRLGPPDYRCKDCDFRDFSRCQCENSTRVRNEAKIDSLRILAPLRHLRNVKKADIVGLTDDSAHILTLAMTAPDHEKPVDLCRPFERLLTYTPRLNLEDEKQAVEVYKQLNFPELELRTSDDPLLAPFAHTFSVADKADQDLLECPKWIEHDMSVVKDAVYCDDVQAFYTLRKKVLDRINETMLAMQRDMVLEGEV